MLSFYTKIRHTSILGTISEYLVAFNLPLSFLSRWSRFSSFPRKAISTRYPRQTLISLLSLSPRNSLHPLGTYWSLEPWGSSHPWGTSCAWRAKGTWNIVKLSANDFTYQELYLLTVCQLKKIERNLENVFFLGRPALEYLKIHEMMRYI